MGALTIQYVLLAVVALAILLAVGPPLVKRWLLFRGKRLVTCPETKRPAAVEVDAKHAAASVFSMQDHPDLRLQDCSRWPERKDCGQECLAQIEAGPEGCLVRTIVAKWYEGKACTLCGKPFGEMHWYEHKPALMNPRHETVEWTDVPIERLPEVLSTHRPLCWSCHIAETFRREHPELVVDRPWKGPSSSSAA